LNFALLENPISTKVKFCYLFQHGTIIIFVPPGSLKVGSKKFFCSLRSRNCPSHLWNRGAAPG